MHQAARYASGPVEGEVDNGGVVAALGPGPLPTLGVDGLGGPDLVEQLVGAVLVQQRQQLLPGGEPEGVDESAGAVAQQHGALERLAGEGAGEGLAGCLRIGGRDLVAAGAVAGPPQGPGELPVTACAHHTRK